MAVITITKDNFKSEVLESDKPANKAVGAMPKEDILALL